MRMKLYLARHGLAVSPDIDLECPLSSEGEREVTSVADFLQQSAIKIPHIYHSNKKRAMQTAQIYHHAIGCGEIKEVPGVMAETIAHLTEDTLFVGHLPFMGLMVSQLVSKNQQAQTVEFVPATVICLEKSGFGDWIISWAIRPDLFQ